MKRVAHGGELTPRISHCQAPTIYQLGRHGQHRAHRGTPAGTHQSNGRCRPHRTTLASTGASDSRSTATHHVLSRIGWRTEAETSARRVARAATGEQRIPHPQRSYRGCRHAHGRWLHRDQSR
ncbi:hypothetical protein Kostya_143 [Mycobacterium phage Kostya]|uniref:Uncharacterized protein n=1 Tax=Mycobacterium phage Kostya TaxID=2914016 RepID=B5A7A3_9CAUD|nr:hypothetical protein Kostya_143 [Mycobacterium phage Kostya]ACF34308.1 hypothetical protein Kostya_143 [Mycobacterium phage Kostya]